MDFHIEQQQDKSVIIFDKTSIINPEVGGIQNAVRDLIEKDVKSIVFDLSKVEYISSYGVGMLIYAHTTCTKRNIEFHVVGVSEKVHEILKIVHLDKIFKILSG